MATNNGCNGADLVLLVNIGTATAPAYQVAGGQRDCTIEETTASIDVSSKDYREERAEPGRYASTISLDQLYVPNETSYAALKAAMRNGEKILIARQETISDVETVVEIANCVVESLSESHPDQAESVVACGLKVDGAWEPVGS